MRKIKVAMHSNMPLVGMRMPAALVDYVDKLGRKTCRTKSDIIRMLVIEALIARGVVETADDIEGA